MLAIQIKKTLLLSNNFGEEQVMTSS